MRAGAPEWRARLLLIGASFLAGLIAAEAAVRVLLRSAPAEGALGTPISELSPVLGWKTRPTGSQRIRREEFDVTITINTLGLRGPEISYEALPGTRRLAIMGDSFAHGYYADEPLTLRGRLATALAACSVDVLNAGSPGYSTDQEWLYFTTEIKKYRPSEVVVLFYYNDLRFNLEAVGTGDRAKPVFVEQDGAFVLRPPAEGTTAPGPSAVGDAALLPPPRAAKTFHGSALWGFAADRIQRSWPDWQRRLAATGLMPELSTTPPAEFLPFGPLGDAERSRVEAMWNRTERILKQFQADVRGSGAGFSVLYVPARFEVNDPAWRFLQRRYEPDRPWRRDAVKVKLASLLARLDIPLVETESDFAKAEGGPQPAYLPLDGHWNARGNEIAFDALYPTVRRVFGCAS